MSAAAGTSPAGQAVGQTPDTSPAGPAVSQTPMPVDEACPLCGAPLHPEQEWCLSCGAAARTRLAAPTNWKAPLVAIGVVGALALGVLAASIVKLSGGSGTAKTPPPVTTTITASTPVTPGAIPTTGAATGATGATGPSGITGPSGAAAQGGGVPAPGTPTTLTPSSTSTAGTQTPGASSTTTTRTITSPAAAEEALRKAGFLPRTKK